MRKTKFASMAFLLVFVSLMAVISLTFLDNAKKINAEGHGGYYESFDDAEIGVTQVPKRWSLMIYDGLETGVSEMPGEELGKCLKISNVTDGITTSGDWMNNSAALLNFNKEVNIMSVDFYIPEGVENFSDEDCLFVQLRQPSANFVAFCMYGDSIREYTSTKLDTARVYKDSIKRGEWVNVSVYYYPESKTYSVYYKEQGSEAELILDRESITPSKWTNTGMTDFRIMSRFMPTRELHYFYLDNIDCYATNKSPYLSNVVIDGIENKNVGERLSCGYIFHSDLGLTEKNTTIQWYRSEDLKPGDVAGNIEYYPIEGANGLTYTTTDEDLFHYVYYTAKPVDSDGNEGIEYTSGMNLIFLESSVNDFESNEIGSDAGKNFLVRENGASCVVKSANDNKFVSFVAENNALNPSVSIESAFQYGLRNGNVSYENDLYISKSLPAGTILSSSFVFTKDLSLFGRSEVEAFVIENSSIHIGLSQESPIPIGEWFKVKIVLVKGENIEYFIELSTKDKGTFYISQKEEIALQSAIDLYSLIGVSSVMTKYEALTSEDMVDVSLDNILLTYQEDYISFMGVDFGRKPTGADFEYDFNTLLVGDIDDSKISFACVSGSLPRGISIKGNKLTGSFTRNGIYEFEISATDNKGNETISKFRVEVVDSYTITFNSNMGSEIDSLILVPGSKISNNLIPERNGYLFMGWEREDGSIWNYSEDTVMKSETLSAKWQTKKYLLTLIDTDGSVLYTNEVNYKNEVVIPSEYASKDWYTSKEYDESFVEGTTMPAKSYVLYAKGNGNTNKDAIQAKASGCKGMISSIALAPILLIPVLVIRKRREE